MADVPLNVGDRVIFNANQAADTVMGQSPAGLWLGIANPSQTPTADPTGGGVLYVQAGALFYVGSSGTVTKLADA